MLVLRTQDGELFDTDRKLFYLATPYSKHPGGPVLAYRRAAEIAARLMRKRLSVFCPIAHSHPIATYGALDPLDHDLWMPLDHEFMQRCDALIVAEMDGWRESYGVTQERAHFKCLGKPTFYLCPRYMTLAALPHNARPWREDDALPPHALTI
jgi:hypothetical protein